MMLMAGRLSGRKLQRDIIQLCTLQTEFPMARVVQSG